MSNTIGIRELLEMLTAELDDLPDRRQPSPNTRYTVKDALLGANERIFYAIAVVFSPSTPDAQPSGSRQRRQFVWY